MSQYIQEVIIHCHSIALIVIVDRHRRVRLRLQLRLSNLVVVMNLIDLGHSLDYVLHRSLQSSENNKKNSYSKKCGEIFNQSKSNSVGFFNFQNLNQFRLTN